VGVAAHAGVLGRVETALEIAMEASAMISDEMGPSEVAAIETGRAYWLLSSGRLGPALTAFDRIIEISRGDPHVGREIVGYSPLIWAETLAAWALACAGNFADCWPRAERAVRLAREHQARENLGWALGVLAQEVHLAGGVSGSPINDIRSAALEAAEIADQGGSRYTQIHSSASLAIAYFVSGDFDASSEGFTAALEQSQAARTALESRPYNLALVADLCLTRGDAAGAVTRAREAIEFADTGGSWFMSALGRTMLADALVCTGAPAAEITAVIAEARQLVNKSGGNSLLPRLRAAEARLAGRNDRTLLDTGLREAEAMYRTMGAPDRADRLIAELGG
jgi:tetratricopeptide (TPR) repeat protein